MPVRDGNFAEEYEVFMWNFLVKEKSWSVRLINGYVQNDQITSDQCKGCDSSTQLVVANNGNPNLVLYGCGGHKCKHRLIRMNFSSINYLSPVSVAASLEDLENSEA
jgi:hypothetical protein